MLGSPGQGLARRAASSHPLGCSAGGRGSAGPPARGTEVLALLSAMGREAGRTQQEVPGSQLHPQRRILSAGGRVLESAGDTAHGHAEMGSASCGDTSCTGVWASVPTVSSHAGDPWWGHCLTPFTFMGHPNRHFLS